jgi:tRNA dimethylallyltransferase
MKKVILLLGPTGVGKTGASILLAKALDSEIISSDSMQIYRYMDIGTAKPSLEQRQAVRHHMIDVANPWEYYSTGEYIRSVQPMIENLHSRGKIPIIVGGTGLYLKAMTRGIFAGPSADWQLRENLEQKELQTPGYLYGFLKEVDPASANKIMPNDLRRIIRALEVYYKGQKPISEFRRSSTKPLLHDFMKVGLTRDRNELYRLIEERVDKMMTEGLVEEVKKVMSLIAEHSGCDINRLPALQAIGYKELALYFKEIISLTEAATLIKKRTRNYAKRQFGWFKKEEGINWIDISGINEPEEIFGKVSKIVTNRI